MFSNISNIGSFARKVTKHARGKAIMAAAVAATGLGLVSVSSAAFTDVTSISTTLTPGLPTTVSNVSGYGPSYTPFTANTNWNVTYDNNIDKVQSITSAGTTYSAFGLATNVIRRSIGPANDQIWEDGTYNTSSKSVVLQGTSVSGFSQAFDTNNLLVGADNLFANSANLAGNNTNVDRLDMLFNSGFQASSQAAFAIFERGLSSQHDSFKIAAITALDSNGNPANYGTLYSETYGTWGKTDVAPAQSEVIMRTDDTKVNDPLHPSDSTDQAVGGVLVKTSDLVPAGTTIYGYSLFAPTATGSGTELVNWTDTTYFKPASDGTTATSGGIDPLSTVAVLFTTNSVPEPTTLSLAVLGAGAVLVRRPRRKA